MKSDNIVTIVGAGAWGTALAVHAAKQGLNARLWGRRAELVRHIQKWRENIDLLPGINLPLNILTTDDPQEAVRDSSLILWVVPSHCMRDVVKKFVPILKEDIIHISASKGIEDLSFVTMTEVLSSELRPFSADMIGVLSGPSFAREVAEGLPTAVTLAIKNLNVAQKIQALLSSPGFRIYTTEDVLGVELGGALKNVYAIGAGICDGLSLGFNARASFLTRALAEMSRLAIALGANPMTLSGLSGMGDLILTATGDLSRNRRVGLRLGAGENLSDILLGSREVAEGVKNTRTVFGLGQKFKVKLPMATEVYNVLYENKNPRQGMVDLLTRRLKKEIENDSPRRSQ